MKKKLLIILLIPIFVCTKCADKDFNVEIINKSKDDYLLFAKSNNIPLKEMIKDRGKYVPHYVIVNHNETIIDTTLSEYDLDFYLSKDKEFYTFYFYKIKDVKSCEEINYVIDKRYDSINVDIDDIQLGNEGRNVFIFNRGKIYFKNSAPHSFLTLWKYKD